jgi:hypothetical protein
MRQPFPTVSAVCVVLIASAAAAGQSSRGEPKRPDAKVLAFFATARWTSVEDFLRSRRPAPLSQELRAQVIARLPRDGELQPTSAERRKLAALDAVLDFHDRKGIIEVKLIEVVHAAVALYARTVLLVSRDALALLTSEELQAVAAHELAHEYSWEDYQAAIKENAWERRQELELTCDGFAVMTLRALGVNPGRLTSAVTKLTRYNERVGAAGTTAAYVSLEDRRWFIETVAGLVEKAKQGRAAAY